MGSKLKPTYFMLLVVFNFLVAFTSYFIEVALTLFSYLYKKGTVSGMMRKEGYKDYI